MSAYPFRLGTTSYVIAGDLADNAAYLAKCTGDMELILFETATGESNYPNADMVDQLLAISDAHNLTYTVHLPFDLQFDPEREHSSLVHAKHVMNLTMPLTLHAYVFHLEGADTGSPGWVEQGIRAIEVLLPCVDDPRTLTLENLENYPPELLEPVFSALPIARAFDVGHVWKMRRDALPVLAHWLPDARVVHLHGWRDVDGARVDHGSLDLLDAAVLDPVITALRDWQGVLTLEVFEDDYATSLAAFDAAWERVTI